MLLWWIFSNTNLTLSSTGFLEFWEEIFPTLLEKSSPNSSSAAHELSCQLSSNFSFGLKNLHVNNWYIISIWFIQYQYYVISMRQNGISRCIMDDTDTFHRSLSNHQAVTQQLPWPGPAAKLWRNNTQHVCQLKHSWLLPVSLDSCLVLICTSDVVINCQWWLRTTRLLSGTSGNKQPCNL
jgi:hypothetical protein